jgi:formylglycine-generating enzyme required for sulfatase activity
LNRKRLPILLSAAGILIAGAAMVASQNPVEVVVEEGTVITNPIGMKFRLIQPGSFTMGSEKNDDEKPLRKVTLTKPFYIGVHEVTQEQYEKVMDENPSHFVGKDLPVDRVTWGDAQDFCEELSDLDPAGSYRLPTEAEWEYACRAGTNTLHYWGDDFDDDFGWHSRNSGKKSHPVGTRKPNQWGLHDMSGNMWEWTQDYYTDKNPAGPLTDPTGPAQGTLRVIRGGSWFTPKRSLRSANRHRRIEFRGEEDTSFRVVFVPNEK